MATKKDAHVDPSHLVKPSAESRKSNDNDRKEE
jgi:hypothetical protein